MHTPNTALRFRALVWFLPALLLFSACKPDKTPLVIPDTYDGAAFASHTAAQAAVRSALTVLTDEMKKGRVQANTVSFSTLTQLYTSGAPSLSSLTSSYYRGRIEGSGGWLDNLAQASGNAYTPGAPAGSGGVFGGYLLDEHGLELEQMVEKGLFAAAMYNHAITLMQGPLTEATPDQLLSIFGAHPDFPNTTTAANTANPDKFMAQYAARRDKSDGTGLYSQMEAALIKLQAAIAAGEDYGQERDEALQAYQRTWEKVCFATVINYCHTTISRLSATSPTDADRANAIHAYGEAVGFTHGWRTLPQEFRLITDAQLDELLTLMNAPYDAAPASYKFLTDPVSELPKLTQVIGRLQTIYGFTNQEVEDFRENWVSKQGR